MTLETLAASLSSEAVDSWCLEDIPSPIEVSNFGDKDFGTDQDLFFFVQNWVDLRIPTTFLILGTGTFFK